MKRLILATCSILVLVIVIYAANCGPTDPALAPAGSTVTLGEDESIDFDCDPDWDIPTSCLGSFRDDCLTSCENGLIQGSNTIPEDLKTQFESCQGAPAACANEICNNRAGWMEVCAGDIGLAIRDQIISTPGSCGYADWLVSAYVQSGGGTMGLGAPLNKVEVEWIAAGGELYLIDDVPGQIQPLANPYYAETDERGISQIKYHTALPNSCGQTLSYVLAADIGVANARETFDYAAGTASETGGDTVADDDSVVADDDTFVAK